MVLLIPVRVVLRMSVTDSAVGRAVVLTVRAMVALLLGLTSLTWAVLIFDFSGPVLVVAVTLSIISLVVLLLGLVYDRLT